MPKRDPWVAGIHKFHDMMCSNDFAYHWDQFEYIKCLESLKCKNIQFAGPLGALGSPETPLRDPGGS